MTEVMKSGTSTAQTWMQPECSPVPYIALVTVWSASLSLSDPLSV